ncbi:uncharacterized protein MYCFIDRAFT_174572 [Pseudocercospora fijiensis CIRAD86]|uniref:Uncharacterized protein n=1 Tax=Pseudocercospora fijiensis (strain CIRAD86) TaxID=383855 RepID=M2ZVR9_PSEFD|nr:uncharacterized protein MYCFIDRAFT_174572 [Pseudocercospora fijiensis CIRAD86]EME83094.1 hypothetical protein MYCFIDRAFT_174572 [Pseudocercospora fijiensis CIRAD86]
MAVQRNIQWLLPSLTCLLAYFHSIIMRPLHLDLKFHEKVGKAAVERSVIVAEDIEWFKADRTAKLGKPSTELEKEKGMGSRLHGMRMFKVIGDLEEDDRFDKFVDGAEGLRELYEASEKWSVIVSAFEIPRWDAGLPPIRLVGIKNQTATDIFSGDL